MKRKANNKVTYSILVFLSVTLLFCSWLLGGRVAAVSADTGSDAISFDSTYVMDDLKGSSVDGKNFNLLDYGFDNKKPLKIFSFVEYCYSFYATKQDNYGLYVYVYNPQGVNFVYSSIQNKIQFSVGDGSTASFEKYTLQFLNCSTESNYEGLFVKYKVVLPMARKQAVLDALNSTARVYVVSGIELLTEGELNATEYAATGIKADGSSGSVIYRYSGYAAGYGVNNETSTLSCESTEGEVLRLEVHHTSWRAGSGVTNGKSKYTQDSLNSVYFAIPKEFPEKYGYLSEVHCEWLNAVTSWGLVTGNRTIYDKIYNYVGREIGFKNYDMTYAFYVDYRQHHYDGAAIFDGAYLGYNSSSSSLIENKITQLNWLFSAGDELNIADHTTISSEIAKQWYSSEFTGIVGEDYGEVLENKDGKKIYKALFDSVDDEIKDYHIKAEEKKTLISQKWSQSWWEKHVSGGHHKVGDAVPENVEAIHQVTDEDFLSNEEMTCDRLYISVSDYADFKQFYDENKGENNIYLLRFAVTDYVSAEASEYKYQKALIGDNYGLNEVDTNAYFFKQNVFLDFDIIDVTFCDDGRLTVVPVVMSPIDIVPEITPPPLVTEDPDGKGLSLLEIILLVIGVVLLLILFGIVWPYISPVVIVVGRGIWTVVKLPFKAVGALFRRNE